jgi:hypothetical protein
MAWTFEETFDSLSNGDLSGQNSWSGSTKWQVVGSSPTPADGAKCVNGTTNADYNQQWAYRDITAVTEGTVYVSLLRNTSGGSDKRCYFRLQEGSTVVTEVKLINNPPDVHAVTSGPTNQTIATGLSDDTWIRIGIWFNASTDKVKFNVNGGTWSAEYTAWNAFSQVDRIGISPEDNNASSGGYVAVDSISPNYTISSTSTTPSRLGLLGVG